MEAPGAGPAACGILLLDKPLGLSSNAALQRVRHLAHRIKAGHTGSLDPLATGMLPICLGEATRLSGELLSGHKAYRFEMLLGERSATGDAEGEILERLPVPALSEERIAEVLATFVGSGQQVPPMYSALKLQGEPLYRRARRGEVVERAARTIHIEQLTLLARTAQRLVLMVHCSAGTYVRVLAEDIARALGTCGRLDALRRLYVEPFAQEPMVTLEALAALTAAGSPWPLQPPDRAVGHYPALHLKVEEQRALYQGRVVLRELPPSHWRLYGPDGAFLGLGTSADGQLRVRRLFPHPVAM